MANQMNPMTSSDATSDDKLWAMLSYVIPIIIPIVVLLMEDKKNRPFIKAHAMQALVWGIVWVVIGGIVGTILAVVIIGCVIPPLLWILSIYWGVQAYNGKYVNIPVVTNFVKSQGWA
jgi:uncharacterized membrane protein